jgi:RNA polymerase sigma-70 factor (ECF subfamily)
MAEEAITPETWFAEHGDYLFRFAMVRLRNPELAEDVVQETLLAALEGRDQYKGQAGVRTWLVGILKHKIIDYFRKNSHEFSISNLAPSDDSREDIFDREGNWRIKPAAWRNDPLEILEKREFWRTFEGCMSELPQRLAQVFALRELDGFESKEICKLLSISPTNLDVMMYRTRLRLARCLDAKWFETEKARNDLM